MELRPYQTELLENLEYERTKPSNDVLVQLATGGGKTVIISNVVRRMDVPCDIVAHRLEIINQISLTLAEAGIRHNLVIPRANIRDIVADHCEVFRQSFYAINSNVTLASIDTLTRRPQSQGLSNHVLIIDEAHHAVPGNKWGTLIKQYTPGNVIGFTATPMRLDGKSLNKKYGGCFDTLICGIGQRALINLGYLSDYKVFSPSTADLELASLKISPVTGDYNPKMLAANCAKSTLFGDIAKRYADHDMGKLGLTFATNVENAKGICLEFEKFSVPAAVVSAKTPRIERKKLIRDFKEKRILQLVNVDIFSEGFDVPAVEVVSFGRPTASFNTYAQQLGRLLRMLLGKEYGIINDHVGNVDRHGLVEHKRDWGFYDKPKRRSKKEQETKVKTCSECQGVYRAFLRNCPYCGHTPVPRPREVAMSYKKDAELVQYEGYEGYEVGVEKAAWVGEALSLWRGVQQKRELNRFEAMSFFYEHFHVPMSDVEHLSGSEYAKIGKRILRDLELYVNRKS